MTGASWNQPLTGLQLAILEFERERWKYQAAKEQMIRDLFGIPAVRYFQILNRVIDLPAAEVYDPVTVRRLRRQRETRAQVRGGRGQRAAGGAR